jgi:multiple sugar transport system permease protein
MPLTDKEAGAYVPQPVQRRLKNLGIYVTVIVTSVFIAVPIYMMFVVALQPSTTVFEGGQVAILFTDPSLENMWKLFELTDTLLFLRNSFIVTAGTMILSTILSISAGYGLARSEFRGKTYMARAVLFSYMFSPIVLAIPLYVLFFTFGLLNTYVSLIVALTAIASPFTIWLMWQYFQTVPVEIEEAAWVKGAGRWRTLRDVVLPMARPGYISSAIFSFAVAWNDYTMARVVLSQSDMYPITLGSSLFLGRREIGWGETMAVSLLMCIPPFIIALFLQRYLLQGFSVGGLE